MAAAYYRRLVFVSPSFFRSTQAARFELVTTIRAYTNQRFDEPVLLPKFLDIPSLSRSWFKTNGHVRSNVTDNP